MKQDVAIFGDSWGCGEWPDPESPRFRDIVQQINRNYPNSAKFLPPIQKQLEHLGLEQYFTELGYNVFNASFPAESNSYSINQLTKFLHSNQSNCIILFIVTEPTRNFKPDFATFKQDIVDHNGLFEFKRKVLYDDLALLNKLAEKHNQTIHLIGGLSSVPDIQQFPNLSCLCQSWPKFLVGDLHPTVDFDQFGLWEAWLIDGEVINKWISTPNLMQFESAFVDKFIKQLDQLHANQLIFDHPLFYPDKVHPNREGHRILFEYIRKKLGI